MDVGVSRMLRAILDYLSNKRVNFDSDTACDRQVALCDLADYLWDQAVSFHGSLVTCQLHIMQVFYHTYANAALMQLLRRLLISCHRHLGRLRRRRHYSQECSPLPTLLRCRLFWHYWSPTFIAMGFMAADGG